MPYPEGCGRRVDAGNFGAGQLFQDQPAGHPFHQPGQRVAIIVDGIPIQFGY